MIRGLNSVTFNGNTYTTREVKIKTFGQRLIAGESLERELIDHDGRYTSEEARQLDESIFFYVEDKWLNADDEQLATKVRKELV